jgi:two-component system sensor histidine kinase/response regulator
MNKRSDKLIDYFLAAYFVGGCLLAFFYDTWPIAIGVGGLCLLAYYVAKIALPDSNLYQYVLSGVLGIFMAQYIYQMHGLFEMHFLAFIGSAILITYQNWKLQIPIMIIVVVHHALFGYLQDIGFGKVYFTQLDYFSLQTFIIHTLLAAVIFFICGLWAYELKKHSDLKASQNREMARLQREALEAVSVRKEELERHVALLDKAVAQGKFEIASDTMHDIGNAIVGFGTYLGRVSRARDKENLQALKSLAAFFDERKQLIAGAIGEAKAEAIVKMLGAMAESQKSSQEEIERCVLEQENILSNIEDILHIQRQYVEGHEAKERKAVDLGDVINDALAIHSALIQKAGIVLSRELPAGLPLVKGDRTRLVQVMLNVFKNCIDAITLQKGEKKIFVRGCSQDGLLSIEIQDTGNGFDPETGSRLFTRGFTTKASGAGVALNNCRTIMESHGGEIVMGSAGPGKGALTMLRFKI